MSESVAATVLVGPRMLGKRICRLVYLRASDEAWAEEWREGAWLRADLLARHVIKAPLATPRALARAGAPAALGEWDLERACA